jgi:ubiquitin-like 1-activating enzyme E1 B
MDKLWENRQKPIPLNYNQVLNNEIDLNGCEGSSRHNEVNGSTNSSEALKDQRLWPINECLTVFDESIKQLKSRLGNEKFLVWDKDDEPALNFVTAVSNLRSLCFHINRKSKFDVKSMAGNIIPAISSTNSIVGGLITLQCLNILRNLKDSEKDKNESNKALGETCRHIYLRKVGPSAKNLISAYELQKPNPNCLVCCSGQRIPEIEISCSLEETTIWEFIDQIIFAKLHFACPDIQIDGQSTVLWSKEDFDESSDEEKERVKKKLLSDYALVRDKTRLRVYDLLQNHTIIITLRDTKIDKNENEGLFYKMVITKEGDEPMDNNSNEEKLVESNDKPITETANDNNNNNNNNKFNDESITAIDIEDDEEDRSLRIEEKSSISVEEVIITDSDSDSDNPVIIDDDSVDIIEVREKRKLSDIEEESVIKKVKS